MTDAAILRKLDALRDDETIQLAPGTLKAYRSYWNSFRQWCAAEGFNSLPARDVAVVGYLLSRYESGFSLSALKGARNAIAWEHNRAGDPDPTKTENVKAALSLLRRKARKTGRARVRQAPGVRLEHIAMYEDTARPGEGEGRWTKANEAKLARTLALLYTMHNALLRRGEAAALCWGDVTFIPRTGQGRLTVQRSKTSDDPSVRLLTTKAVRYLEAIKPKGCKPTDRVFRVTSGRAIRDRIAAAMKGIRPGATGHSLRVGAAQDMTIRGASLQAVQQAGGWATLDMPAYYASKVKAEVGAVNLLED